MVCDAGCRAPSGSAPFQAAGGQRLPRPERDRMVHLMRYAEVNLTQYPF
jgi:hypothetical protein